MAENQYAALVKYTTPPQPRQVRLDTTTKCSAVCMSCHRIGAPRPSGVMILDDAVHILEDIAKLPLPLTEIVPVNYGEFFLYPEWYTLLKTIEAKLPKTQIVIPTNGSELDGFGVHLLSQISTVKVVNFSVNAYLSHTYEEFCGLPASNIKQIEKAVIYLRNNRPDITLWVSMVYEPTYQSEMEKELFVQHWAKYGVTPQVIPASNCNRYPLRIKTSLPCRSLFSDLVIGYDSKLSSCCFDAGFRLDLGEYDGSRYKCSVLEAWRNKKLEELRRLHNDGCRTENSWCAGCSFA